MCASVHDFPSYEDLLRTKLCVVHVICYCDHPIYDICYIVALFSALLLIIC